MAIDRAEGVTYDSCLDAMFGLHRFGIKLGLDLIRRLLAGVGNPQACYTCIHVAGTNGKGSIASTLATILQASGLKIGLYTSPHLERFNERIRINGDEVTDRDVVEAYKTISSVHSGDRQATFFECTTAMGLLLFARHTVDLAIIETGMGGRLDATNIITPCLSIISNISIEHREYLGDTLAAIATEKGGIIKPGVPVITGARQKTAHATLKDIARRREAPFYRFGQDFRVRRTNDGTFSYYGFGERRHGLATALQGRHQVDNAALVLAACDLLRKQGIAVGETVIRKGLGSASWPGRLEIVQRKPLTVVDGAHNLAAVQRLSEYLGSTMKDRKLTLVVGILDDKPYHRMLALLVPLCHRIIFTRPRINRALSPETLFQASGVDPRKACLVEDVPSAVAKALENTAPEDAVCIAGSLYVVGEARQAFERMPAPLS